MIPGELKCISLNAHPASMGWTVYVVCITSMNNKSNVVSPGNNADHGLCNVLNSWCVRGRGHLMGSYCTPQSEAAVEKWLPEGSENVAALAKRGGCSR